MYKDFDVCVQCLFVTYVLITFVNNDNLLPKI